MPFHSAWSHGAQGTGTQQRPLDASDYVIPTSLGPHHRMPPLQYPIWGNQQPQDGVLHGQHPTMPMQGAIDELYEPQPDSEPDDDSQVIWRVQDSGYQPQTPSSAGFG